MAFVINGDPSTRQALQLSPGHGKTSREGERRGEGGEEIYNSDDTNTLNTWEGTHTLLPQWTVRWKCFGCKWVFNNACRFEESFRVQPQESGSLFVPLSEENARKLFEVALLLHECSSETTSILSYYEKSPSGYAVSDINIADYVNNMTWM